MSFCPCCNSLMVQMAQGTKFVQDRGLCRSMPAVVGPGRHGRAQAGAGRQTFPSPAMSRTSTNACICTCIMHNPCSPSGTVGSALLPGSALAVRYCWGSMNVAASPSGMLCTAVSTSAGSCPCPSTTWQLLHCSSTSAGRATGVQSGARQQRNCTSYGGRAVCQPLATACTTLRTSPCCGSGFACTPHSPVNDPCCHAQATVTTCHRRSPAKWLNVLRSSVCDSSSSAVHKPACCL